MMALLRSRTTMYVLASVVVVGLVVSAAVGLFNSLGSVPPGAQQTGQEGGAPPAQAPDVPEVSSLGDPPPGLSYTSDPEDGVYCRQEGCALLVTVLTEDGEITGDARATVREVYDHLLDRDWKIMLPEGAESPEDVPPEQTVLTDETVMIADSSTGAAGEPAVLMVRYADLTR
ncbi:hypothetical protein [Nocardiopsis sp. CC223A]|uniref:hypothetical protein n=1 Tax=Nocardiopsis sp. CC223A TaxID=3044051 RepID=UPI00278C7E12|nr:hypothetical protein [Nocardiopsis sp. CC223A]